MHQLRESDFRFTILILRWWPLCHLPPGE